MRSNCRGLLCALVVGVLALAAIQAHAATLYYVDFNQPFGAAPDPYVPSGVEVLPGGTTMSVRGSPSIVAAPAGPGAEGGGALRTVPASGSQGYAITSGPNLTGSFTAEAIIRVDSINPAGNTAGLQDILNAETTPAANILRVDSSGQIHFYPMYNSGGGANPNVRIASAGAITPDRYWHVAAVWDQATGNAELFVNGVSSGTLSRAGHAGTTFGSNFAVSNNNNPGYNPRSIDGVMDAFAVSDAALTPGQFVLNAPPAYLITFDQGAQAPAPSPYVPGTGEILPPGAGMALRGSPSLVDTPPLGVRQGGQALATSGGTSNQGYYATGGASLTGSHTVEMIYQADSLNPAGNQAGLQDLINSEDSASSDGRTILRINSGGKFEYYPMFGGGGTNATGRIVSRNQIITGQLQHVAAVFDDATDTATLYLNGVPQGALSRAGYTSLATFSRNFAIANNQNTSRPRNLDGNVDALAVTARALDPSQFVYADLPMAGYDFAAANGEGLFVQPAVGDLVEGKVPVSTNQSGSPVGLQAGTSWAALTDGLGTTGHPSMTTRTLADDGATSPTNPWQLTFALDSPSQVREVRAFTQNPDGRLWQDYDVEISSDGASWSMLAAGVTNGARGVSVNDWGDANLGDWSATAVRRLDGQPMTARDVNYVRFTLRKVTTSGGAFAPLASSNYNSFLYEIDVLGDGTPSLQDTPVGGGYSHPSLGGGPGIIDGNPGTIGYIGGAWPPGAGTQDGGQFGAAFEGRSDVTAFAVTQDGVAGGGGFRHRLRDITVHAGNGRTYQFTLADTYNRQVVMLPESIQTSYLLITADSLYTSGSADDNVGIVEFEAFGFLHKADTNHNLGLTPSIVGGLGGFNFPSRATDGVVHTNANSADNSTFFARNAGQDSATVDYGQEVGIASIGIGWAEDTTPIGLRDMPRFVTLQTDEGDFIFPVDDLIQYSRFDLPYSVDTSFARLLFPDGANTAGWYLHNDANYGITEFQAFLDPLQIPEPTTFVMLAVGGLGLILLRQRRQR